MYSQQARLPSYQQYPNYPGTYQQAYPYTQGIYPSTSSSSLSKTAVSISKVSVRVLLQMCMARHLYVTLGTGAF